MVDLVETFEYDELNRLTRSAIAGNSVELYQLGGNDVVTYEYNELGNLTFKSDVGSYTYGQASGNAHAGPHAVTNIQGDASKGHKNTNYAYDDNGNMTSGDGRTIEYTSFNKPKDVRGDGNPSQFEYGPERQMIKQVEQTGTVPKTTLYFGRYEKIYDGYQTTEKYHLSTPNGGVIGVIIDREDQAAPTTHYLHRDHLDSIVAISNEQGYVIERFFYDAFGKQLTAVTPDGVELHSNTPTLHGNTRDRGLTDRGFTGHKTIQSGLVHMGGRVYDPAIGRFLSADPHIQFAGNLQNYNRYSYVNNNPLSFNDPTGYFISKIFKALKKLFKMVTKIIKKVMKVIKKVVKFVKENLKVVIAVVAAVAIVATGGAALGLLGAVKGGALVGINGALTAAGKIAVGALAGGVSSLISTGSLSGALKGAFTGALFAGVGNMFAEGGTFAKYAKNAKNAAKALKTGLHGVVGGISSKLNGGSFSKGFLSAAVPQGLNSYGVTESLGVRGFQGMGLGQRAHNALVSGVIGGATADLVGGSFKHGFLTAAVARAANDDAHSGEGVFSKIKKAFAPTTDKTSYYDFYKENDPEFMEAFEASEDLMTKYEANLFKGYASEVYIQEVSHNDFIAGFEDFVSKSASSSSFTDFAGSAANTAIQIPIEGRILNAVSSLSSIAGFYETMALGINWQEAFVLQANGGPQHINMENYGSRE